MDRLCYLDIFALSDQGSEFFNPVVKSEIGNRTYQKSKPRFLCFARIDNPPRNWSPTVRVKPDIWLAVDLEFYVVWGGCGSRRLDHGFLCMRSAETWICFEGTVFFGRPAGQQLGLADRSIGQFSVASRVGKSDDCGVWLHGRATDKMHI